MKTLAKLLLIVFIVGGTLASSPVYAGAAGYASVQGLKFTVVDLDSMDGVTAALTRINVPAPDPSTGGTEIFLPGGYWSLDAPFATLSKSSSDADQTTTAYLSSGEARVTLASSAGYNSAQATGTVRASTVAPGLYGFVLTPNTSLLIEAQLHTAVAAAVPSWRGDSAIGVAEMNLFRPSPWSGSTTIVGQARALANASWNPGVLDSEIEYDESLLDASILFENRSNQAVVLGFSFSASVSGLGATPGIPTIPEPSTWALLSLGLLAIFATTSHGRHR